MRWKLERESWLETKSWLLSDEGQEYLAEKNAPEAEMKRDLKLSPEKMSGKYRNYKRRP